MLVRAEFVHFQLWIKCRFNALFEIACNFYCRGANWFGQLGYGDNNGRSAPIASAVGIGGPGAALAGGVYHTCALLVNGTVTCWGANDNGELGYGDTVSRLVPGGPVALPVSAMSIASGNSHTCVLLVTSGVRCWGNGGSLQLGYSDTVTRTSPPLIDVPLGVPVTQLSLGLWHSCALLSNSSVACWGGDWVGQTGLATAMAGPGVLGIGPAVAVFSSALDSCALYSSGNITCWGANVYGASGYGDVMQRNVPGPIVPISGRVASMAGGTHFMCALSDVGAVSCWGLNTVGQLGSGSQDVLSVPSTDMPYVMAVAPASSTPSATPSCSGTSSGTVTVTASLTGTRTMTASPTFTASPTLTATSTTTSSFTASPTITPTPVPVIRHTLAAGDGFTCALSVAGTVRCWGTPNNGVLGYGDSLQRNAPDVIDVDFDSALVISIDAGYNHVCAVLVGSRLRCWGQNSNGQLGYGDTVSRSTPSALDVLSNVASVAAGGSHTCVVNTGGSVLCFGNNVYGALGVGDTVSRLTPVSVPVSAAVRSCAAGEYHTCVLLHVNGSVQCWGRNANGQLGTGDTTDRWSSPLIDVVLGTAAVSLAAGGYHSCAVLSGGSVRCWGGADSGQLGLGDTVQRTAPIADVIIGGAVSAISCGYRFTFAVFVNGSVAAWGGNGAGGQLGVGDAVNRLSPVAVAVPAALRSADALTTGLYFTCVLYSQSNASCWGQGTSGQLGVGDTAGRLVPPPVFNAFPQSNFMIAKLVSGSTAMHTCAISTTGALRCWGDNIDGHLGSGGAMTARFISSADVAVGGLVTAGTVCWVQRVLSQ